MALSDPQIPYHTHTTVAMSGEEKRERVLGLRPSLSNIRTLDGAVSRQLHIENSRVRFSAAYIGFVDTVVMTIAGFISSAAYIGFVDTVVMTIAGFISSAAYIGFMDTVVMTIFLRIPVSHFSSVIIIPTCSFKYHPMDGKWGPVPCKCRLTPP